MRGRYRARAGVWQRRLPVEYLVHIEPLVRAVQDGWRHRRGRGPHPDPARELPSQPRPVARYERDGHAPSYRRAHERSHRCHRDLGLRAPRRGERVRERALLPAEARGGDHELRKPAGRDASDHANLARSLAAAPHRPRARRLRHACRYHQHLLELRDHAAGKVRARDLYRGAGRSGQTGEHAAGAARGRQHGRRVQPTSISTPTRRSLRARRACAIVPPRA